MTTIKFQTYDVIKREKYIYTFKRAVSFFDKHLGYVISVVLAMKLLHFYDFFIITGFIFIMYILTRRLVLDAKVTRQEKGN